MGDNSPDVALDDAPNPLPVRPPTDPFADALTAIRDHYAAGGTPIYNSVPWEVVAPLMAAAASYATAFGQTLGKHHADALNDAVRTRIRKNGKTRELHVGPEDGSAAILVVTSKTPDEARLALLDLDVTSDEVRGRTLRWDGAAMAWRADSADD